MVQLMEVEQRSGDVGVQHACQLHAFQRDRQTVDLLELLNEGALVRGIAGLEQGAVNIKQNKRRGLSLDHQCASQ